MISAKLTDFNRVTF